MNSDPFSDTADLPVYGEDADAWYSLAVVAELAGLNTHTVLQYRQKGLLRPTSQRSGDPSVFDIEDLRQLRRIEHLRTTYEVNEGGLKFILNLLHEVEHLRHERRQRLR